MGRDDVSVSIGQCVAAKSVDHLTTGVLPIVDLKRIPGAVERMRNSSIFSILCVVMSNVI